MKTLFGSKTVLGFTGTQVGMTTRQRAGFIQLLALIKPTEFHHGDCVGADADAHALVREYAPKCKIVIHPPVYKSRRAFCDGDLVLEPKPYLDRNHDIVKASEHMVATPGQDQEQLRSGTWSTIRATLKAKKRLAIIFPKGEIERS